MGQQSSKMEEEVGCDTGVPWIRMAVTVTALYESGEEDMYGRANAACISLRSPSFPFTFSLVLPGRSAPAAPPAAPTLSACLVPASRSQVPSEQSSAPPPPLRQAPLTSTGPSLSSTSASPSFTNRHQSSRRNGKPGVARIRSLRLPHGHCL